MSAAEAGNGGAPLLLLHGFTGAKEDFADWIDAFATHGYHVVAPDLRGHGASGQPADESAYSLATYSADARALADELGWDRFALLGHSMGGMVAQCVALDRPDRLTALVLMDTTCRSVEGIDPDLAKLAVEVARREGLERLMALMDEHESPLTTAADQRVRAEREGYVAFGERKFRACSPAMYAAMALELLEQTDRLPQLATLSVPTLVVVGDQDTPFLDVSREMADAIPGASMVVLPDAGHSPQFEAPEAWWDVVSGFLDDAVSGAPPRGSR
jgi:pimeloyl-ACP methyl ester carboxylesterase